jgi:hypothetical protein
VGLSLETPEGARRTNSRNCEGGSFRDRRRKARTLDALDADGRRSTDGALDTDGRSAAADGTGAVQTLDVDAARTSKMRRVRSSSARTRSDWPHPSDVFASVSTAPRASEDVIEC